jgi:hypothetical protein
MRGTPLLQGMLEAIALALAGRAGARLASAFGLPAGRSTMLRLVGALPDPAIGGVAVLGVDLSRARIIPMCCSHAPGNPWWAGTSGRS